MIKSFFVYLCMALMVCTTSVVEAGGREKNYDYHDPHYHDAQSHKTPHKQRRTEERKHARHLRKASTCQKASCLTTGVILIALVGSGLIYYALSAGDGDVSNNRTTPRGMAIPVIPKILYLDPAPPKTTIPIYSVSKASPRTDTIRTAPYIPSTATSILPEVEMCWTDRRFAFPCKDDENAYCWWEICSNRNKSETLVTDALACEYKKIPCPTNASDIQCLLTNCADGTQRNEIWDAEFPLPTTTKNR